MCGFACDNLLLALNDVENSVGGGWRCHGRNRVRGDSDRTLGQRLGPPGRRELRVAGLRDVRRGVRCSGCLVGAGPTTHRLDLSDGRPGRLGSRIGVVDLLRDGAAPVPVPVAGRCGLSDVPVRRGIGRRCCFRVATRTNRGPVSCSTASSSRARCSRSPGCFVMQSVYNTGGTTGFALGLSLTYPVIDIAILTRRGHGVGQSTHRAAYHPGDAHRRRCPDGVVRQCLCVSVCA